MKISSNNSRLFVLLCSAVFLAAACTTAPEPSAGFQPEVLPLPADPSDYAPISSYAAMDIPADNPITAEKVALGRQKAGQERAQGLATDARMADSVWRVEGLYNPGLAEPGWLDKQL